LFNQELLFWNVSKKAKYFILSPDCSENPFAFSFKKQKITTESGTMPAENAKFFCFKN